MLATVPQTRRHLEPPGQAVARGATVGITRTGTAYVAWPGGERSKSPVVRPGGREADQHNPGSEPVITSQLAVTSTGDLALIYEQLYKWTNYSHIILRTQSRGPR